jgi:hypothetical protein
MQREDILQKRITKEDIPLIENMEALVVDLCHDHVLLYAWNINIVFIVVGVVEDSIRFRSLSDIAHELYRCICDGGYINV